MNLSRDGLKRSLAPFFMAALVVVVAAATIIVGTVERRSRVGADPSTAFTPVPEGVTALADLVRWDEDGPLQDRPVEPTTRRSIEAAWTRAWNALQHAAAGDDSMLEAWFAGAAIDQVRAVQGAGGAPTTVRFGEHVLRIDFYSDDGSILGLRAGPVEVERSVEGHVLRTRETIDAVFFLEDGNWRIRQWLRSDVEILTGA